MTEPRLDMTREMVDKAKANVNFLGLTNVDFQFGDVEVLPFDGNCFDVVITNGLFNLCVSKAEVLVEVFRVLRPGGRIQTADILLHDDVTPKELATKGTWSDWIALHSWSCFDWRKILLILAILRENTLSPCIETVLAGVDPEIRTGKPILMLLLGYRGWDSHWGESGRKFLHG